MSVLSVWDNLSKLKRDLIILAVILGIAYGFHSLDKHYALKELNNAWIGKLQKEAQRQKDSEGRLKEAAQKDKEKKDEEIKALNSRVTNLVTSLQQRPRRELSSKSSNSGSSCTGAKLYREDGEFLAGEASRAEKAIVQRDYYYNAYENARLELERLKNGN